MTLRTVGVVLSLALGSVPIQAQSDPYVVPKRPKLAATADTNSAPDYYWHGMSVLTRRPDEAAAAFYWASRIDPNSADAVYGRHAALLLAQPYNRLNSYMMNRHDDRLRSIDSLAYAALMRNPWVNRRVDGAVFKEWIGEDEGVRVPRFYRDEHPELGAWMYYLEGKFDLSAEQYVVAFTKYPNNHLLRFRRAAPLLALGQVDSAVTSVREALTAFRQSPVDSLNYGYVGYPFLEYSLGILLAAQKNTDSAQAAYERALLDDVTFAPAHLALGRLRLSLADTSGALREMNAAVTLTPNDPVLLYEVSILSLAGAQPDSVLTYLRRATTAEPFYLQPHFALARLYDLSGFKEEAIQEYRTILQLAPRTMTAETTAVRGRLTALGATP